MGGISIPVVCDFLLFLFKKGLKPSSLNVARSALSFFFRNLSLANNSTVTRLFRYFYMKRPLRPKYLTFWPIKKLLDFLATWHPISELSLKQLTLKTIALIALTCSDRGQTIHLMNIEKTHIDEDGISFVIFDRLKSTRKVIKPKVVKCITSEVPALNVCDYVLAYLNRTIALRAGEVTKGKPKPTQFFLSWATKRPVTKATLARWLTTVLKLAGINTEQFTAHSYRGASLSGAHEKGASIDQIVKAGNWKSVDTFKSHYCAPTNTSAVGRLILEHYTGEQFKSAHISMVVL